MGIMEKSGKAAVRSGEAVAGPNSDPSPASPAIPSSLFAFLYADSNYTLWDARVCWTLGLGCCCMDSYFLTKKVVLDRDPISIFSVLAERDVFLVNFELSAVRCENNQLVSGSKFKLVCQVVNANKPKKGRVTHLQLKGVTVLLLK